MGADVDSGRPGVPPNDRKPPHPRPDRPEQTANELVFALEGLRYDLYRTRYFLASHTLALEGFAGLTRDQVNDEFTKRGMPLEDVDLDEEEEEDVPEEDPADGWKQGQS